MGLKHVMSRCRRQGAGTESSLFSAASLSYYTFLNLMDAAKGVVVHDTTEGSVELWRPNAELWQPEANIIPNVTV